MQVGDYLVKFWHDTRHGYTDCMIFGAGPDPVGQGQASVHHNDRFERRKGRMVAFTKALDNMTEGLESSGQHQQARQERSKLWEGYFKVMPRDRGVTFKFNERESSAIRACLAKLSTEESAFLTTMLER